jgi:hypothetical protein
MATVYPENIDSFVNPLSTDSVQLVSHAAQHSNTNDAIIALQTKLGKNGSLDTGSIENRLTTLKSFVDNITTANVAESLSRQYYTAERAQDAVASSIIGKPHQNITISYDENTNSFVFSTNSNVVLQDALDQMLVSYILDEEKAQPNGVATLDENGTVPMEQIPLLDLDKIPNIAIEKLPSQLVTETELQVALDEVAEIVASDISSALDEAALDASTKADAAVVAAGAYTDEKISDLIDLAPDALNTLNELAASLGDDSNFAGTITTSLAGKSNIGHSHTSSNITDFTESVQDSAASLFTHSGHSNVTATYDDLNNKINLAVTAQLTQEQAQDYIAPLFTHGLNPNITATYNDETNNLILETIIPPSKAIMSASAPTSPADGEFWFDTDEYRSGTTRSLKVWQASTSSWQYVSSDLSLSTTNTWTSKNTYTNGVIIGLDSPPESPVHGQIYYNKPLDKLKVWDGLLWQDIQGSGGGGGGLTLIPTDVTAPPSTFFVGLIAPPTGATANGDLWIDVDDIDTPFNQFYTGGVSPDPAQYEFWVDNVEPIQELIYSADEPATPSYEGELWIDTDEFDGAIVEFGATPPNPDNVQLWVDVNENESPSYYKDLTFTNYATVADFPVNAPNGYVASDASSGLAYVRSQGQWLAIVTASNINSIISSNSTIFEDLKALAWMGFE